jgi:hypothetical protein
VNALADYWRERARRTGETADRVIPADPEYRIRSLPAERTPVWRPAPMPFGRTML